MTKVTHKHDFQNPKPKEATRFVSGETNGCEWAVVFFSPDLTKWEWDRDSEIPPQEYEDEILTAARAA